MADSQIPQNISNQNKAGSGSSPSIAPAVKVEDGGRAHPESDYINLLNTSSMAIATTANVASYAIGCFALFLTILAVVGWFALRRTVRKLAQKKLASYLESEHFRNKIDIAIGDALQSRLGTGVIVVTPTSQPIAPAPPSGARP